MADLHPCPICGAPPQVDHGLSDAPFDPPLVYCATVHLNLGGPGEAQGCPMCAESPAIWNALCELTAETQGRLMCRVCGGTLRPGRALQRTVVAGGLDFAGDAEAVTFSAEGPGVLVDCMKCEACGHSTTVGADYG